MAAPKQTNKAKVTSVFKRTNQGGGRPKTSSMNKNQRSSHKVYRGQGR
jgi:hypothetical protein